MAMQKDKEEDMKYLIKKAGLIVGEVANLCGVTRVSVHNWLAGKPINPLRKPRVDKIIKAIANAIQAHDFPLSEGKRQGGDAKAARSVQVKEVIIKHLRALQV